MAPRKTLFFPKDAIIREVAAEPAVMLGAIRALLLQVAHPNVAAGVTDFSNFQRAPFGRLLGTLEATYAVVFGSLPTATGVGARVQWIHDHITGPTYRANDPENLLWVHATLFDTMRMFFTELVRPLSDAEGEALYQQVVKVGALFGCPPSAQPQTLSDFNTYFAATVREIAVNDSARLLAHEIVRPTFPTLPRTVASGLSPLIAPLSRFGIGTLPPSLITQFGFEWTERNDAQLQRSKQRVQSTFRATPRSVRTAPGWLQGRYLLFRAARHVDAFNIRRNAVNNLD